MLVWLSVNLSNSENNVNNSAWKTFPRKRKMLKIASWSVFSKTLRYFSDLQDGHKKSIVTMPMFIGGEPRWESHNLWRSIRGSFQRSWVRLMRTRSSAEGSCKASPKDSRLYIMRQNWDWFSLGSRLQGRTDPNFVSLCTTSGKTFFGLWLVNVFLSCNLMYLRDGGGRQMRKTDY